MKIQIMKSRYGYNYIVIHFLQFTGIGKDHISCNFATYDILGMRYTFIAIYNAWFDTIHPFSTHHPYSFISFHFLNYESTPRYRAVTYYYFMNFVKLPIHRMALYRVTSKYSKVISNVISYSCLWKSYILNLSICRHTFYCSFIVLCERFDRDD